MWIAPVGHSKEQRTQPMQFPPKRNLPSSKRIKRDFDMEPKRLALLIFRACNRIAP